MTLYERRGSRPPLRLLTTIALAVLLGLSLYLLGHSNNDLEQGGSLGFDTNIRLPLKTHDNREGMPVRYDGHRVLRITVRDAAELARLKTLAKLYNFNVWSPWRIGQVDIQVHPEAYKQIDQIIHAPYSVLISDVQALMDRSMKSAVSTKDTKHNHVNETRITQEFFKSYQSFEELAALFAELGDQFKGWTHHFRLGLTHEKREIFGIRIHNPYSKSKKTEKTNIYDAEDDGEDDSDDWSVESSSQLKKKHKKKHKKTKRREIVIVAGLHGREWISTAVASYLAYTLASNYGINPRITSLVDEFEFTIIPLINADGYEYSRTTDRLWRKNRQPTSESECMGTMINTLIKDFDWGQDGSAEDPCSENYAGQKAFSAPETRHLAAYLKQRNRAIAFIDLHSYSQLWMLPYAARCRRIPDNKENMLELALGASESIHRVNGTRFEVGSACEILYRQSGTALDWQVPIYIYRYILIHYLILTSNVWVHRRAQAYYSYWVELRDTGMHGFMLPPEYIIPSGEEILAATLHVGDFIDDWLYG
ncbi:hypothetical protein BDF19DRAFT_410651 [Syncephalis fuscata]|nr:hypothetical protein BDF19DRAFT_410651 [Syncephalis fuscata]